MPGYSAGPASLAGVGTVVLPWAGLGSWVGLVVQALYWLSVEKCQYHLFPRLFGLVVRQCQAVGFVAVVAAAVG